MYLSTLAALIKNFSWRGLAIVLLSLALIYTYASSYQRGREITELRQQLTQKEVALSKRDGDVLRLEVSIREQNQLIQQFSEASKALEDNAEKALSEAKKDRTVYVTKAEKVLVAVPSSPNDCRAAEDLLNKAIQENKQ